MKLLQDNEVKGLNAIAVSLKTASMFLEEIERCCKSSLYTEFSKDIYDAYHSCAPLQIGLDKAMAEVKKMHRDNKEVDRLVQAIQKKEASN